MTLLKTDSVLYNNSEEESFTVVGWLYFHLYLAIYCLIVLIMGVTGNCAVLFVYSRRPKVGTFAFFIKVLSIFDIAVSVTAVPILLSLKLITDLVPSGLTCKIIIAVKHFTVMNAGIFFIIIAIQRFRKVCRPHGTQISKSLAKKMVACSIVLSVLGSIPIIVFIDVSYVSVRFNNNSVNATMCSFDATYSESIVSKLYAGWVMLELLTITSILITLYVMVGRTLRNHSHFQSRSLGRVRRNKTSTVIFFVLSLVFLMTASPNVIVGTYLSLTNTNDQWSYVGYSFYDISVNLVYINCVVNPFVYSFNSTVFRREWRTLFYPQTSQQDSSDPQARVGHIDESTLDIANATL